MLRVCGYLSVSGTIGTPGGWSITKRGGTRFTSARGVSSNHDPESFSPFVATAPETTRIRSIRGLAYLAGMLDLTHNLFKPLFVRVPDAGHHSAYSSIESIQQIE